MDKCKHCGGEIQQLSVRSQGKYLGYDGRHYDHPYWFHVEREDGSASFFCGRDMKTAAGGLLEAEPVAA